MGISKVVLNDVFDGIFLLGAVSLIDFLFGGGRTQKKNNKTRH